MPKISVIMSVYNALPYLDESVNSILRQTESDFEFIIIDDGSTDGSASLLKKFAQEDDRIQLVSRENKGLINSLNEAISLAKAPYIARMDADDIAYPDRLAKQVAYMEKHNLSLCGTHAVTINSRGDEVGQFIYPPQYSALKKYGILHNPFIHPSVMFTQEVIMKVGGYKPFFKHIEDYELWTRIIFKYNSGNLQEPLLKYRIHDNQITKKHHTKMFCMGFLVRILALVRFL